MTYKIDMTKKQLASEKKAHALIDTHAKPIEKAILQTLKRYEKKNKLQPFETFFLASRAFVLLANGCENMLQDMEKEKK